MIIFLYGSDTYRSQNKLNEIIVKYKARHATGLNLSRLNLSENNLDTLRQIVRVSPMFAEKKLIILENVFKLSNEKKQEMLDYLRDASLAASKEITLVISEKKEPDKRSALFQFLAKKDRLVMSQEFALLEGAQLEAWIGKHLERIGGKAEQAAIKKIAAYVGSNLWQLSNELEKLTIFKKGAAITSTDVDLLLQPKISTNIFQTIDALARKDKKTAWRLLRQHLKQGESEMYLLSMFVYQFKNLLIIKDLAERGTAHYQIAAKAKLHPFVVKKSWFGAKNFSPKKLRKIYHALSALDIKLKTGQVAAETALDLMVMEI